VSETEQAIELVEFEAGINTADPRGRLGRLAADALVIRPEVARLVASGVSEAEICESLGVSRQVLKRCMRTSDFGVLFEVEARRVLRHMSHRKLSEEKYLSLATSVCMMIDKMRLVKDELPQIPGGQTAEIIQNITIALYGRGFGASGTGSNSRAEIDVTDTVHELPVGIEPGREDADSTADLVGTLDRQP